MPNADVTVGELISALSELPSDTPILVADVGGIFGLELRGKWSELQVWCKGPETKLYLVNHQATYPDLSDDWEPLL